MPNSQVCGQPIDEGAEIEKKQDANEVDFTNTAHVSQGGIAMCRRSTSVRYDAATESNC